MAGVGALAALAAVAEVKVSGMFSDNMVLQRGKPQPVWGKADAGEKVTVEFAGQKAEATADAKGDWEVKLAPMEACKEGRELKVGGRTFKNVVVGDVWLVSGQSNAEMSMGWVVFKGLEARQEAKNYPNVRWTKFAKRKAYMPVTFETINNPWQVCTFDNLNSVTAMGYFFAREINAKTGVPVGILDNNWSGCRIEPFINEEGMRLKPQFAGSLKRLEAARGRYAAWLKNPDFTMQPFWSPDLENWCGQHNAMVNPIVKFPIAGALWYQGCSNGGEGMEYADKLEALIGGWRRQWGYEFPFYIVQLASFQGATTTPAGGDGYARIRNAMRVAHQRIPKTGLAVAIDIGNARDIHPKNKMDVGLRLSRWALRDVYGMKDLVVSGPLYKAMAVEGDKVRLVFDHVGGGLWAAEKDPDSSGEMPKASADGKLKGFAVAGADKKWHWAEATIDGETVVVRSDKVKEPVAVRYAHRGNPMGNCNLYNKEGLPASPFRTDSW